MRRQLPNFFKEVKQLNKRAKELKLKVKELRKVILEREGLDFDSVKRFLDENPSILKAYEDMRYQEWNFVPESNRQTIPELINMAARPDLLQYGTLDPEWIQFCDEHKRANDIANAEPSITMPY